MINTPKGEMIPQTVENLQHIMALDAVRMQAYAKTIAGKEVTINKLRQKLAACRGKENG